MGAALQRLLVNSWGRRGAMAVLLWPVSLLYGALVTLRRTLYRNGVFKVHRVKVPVIVVGNLVAGGAGKTPVVMALVHHLKARGLRTGVISRGYGRLGRDCREVHSHSLARDVGDEPLLIARNTGAPVMVAAARIEAAGALLAAHPEIDVLVCDDGLQHYAMHRDIEVCVFDQRGTGNGFLLPAGPLREPRSRPVDLVLHAGPHRAGAGFRVQRSLGSHARRADGSLVALSALRDGQNQPGGELHAVAGIAQPEAFFAMLRAQGLHLVHTHALSDHAQFEPGIWSRNSRQTLLLCTEKDATKLWPLFP